MPPDIRGLHHYTYCVGPAQEDVDFHTRLLGLRLLKQTGLFEGTQVSIYHFYYGNAEGDAGTVLTTFPVRQQGLTGRLGTDQVSRLNLSIPRTSIDFWMDRLSNQGARSHPGRDARQPSASTSLTPAAFRTGWSRTATAIRHVRGRRAASRRNTPFWATTDSP